MEDGLTIRDALPFDPEISALIDQLDAYQTALYPSSSLHLESREGLSEPECKLLAAYRGGHVVGMGAAKLMDGYGELKRFFVPEYSRGQGVAECLIATLEEWLNIHQRPFIRLETGIHQPAAIRLYRRFGYRAREIYGDYQPDPTSVFMEKRISADEPIVKKDGGFFYIASFTSQLKEPSSLYSETAEKMFQLVRKQPGFLGARSFRGEEGDGVTTSFWKDPEAISRWREDPAHCQAKQLGRTQFYSRFRLTVAKIEAAM